MCHIVPFIAACCSRQYVTVSKVPSCPDGWPRKKCAPELCIQISTAIIETLDVVCWRCSAERNNLSLEERSRLRPGIDSAEVTKGLDVNVAGRRRLVEDGGHCWFCNARGGCETCGAGMINPAAGDGGRDETPDEPRQVVKGKRKHTGFAHEARTEARGEGRVLRSGKKVKVENQRQVQQEHQYGTGYGAAPSHQGSNVVGYGQDAPNWAPEADDSLNFTHDGLPRLNDYNGESSNSHSNHNYAGENNLRPTLQYANQGQNAPQASPQPQFTPPTRRYGTPGADVRNANYQPKTEMSPTPAPARYIPATTNYDPVRNFASMPPAEVVDGVRQPGRMREQPDAYAGHLDSIYPQNNIVDANRHYAHAHAQRYADIVGQQEQQKPHVQPYPAPPGQQGQQVNPYQPAPGIQGQQGQQRPHAKFDHSAMHHPQYKPSMSTQQHHNPAEIDPRLGQSQTEWQDGLYSGEEDAFGDYFNYGEDADEESNTEHQTSTDQQDDKDQQVPLDDKDPWANTDGGIDFAQDNGAERAGRGKQYGLL